MILLFSHSLVTDFKCFPAIPCRRQQNRDCETQHINNFLHLTALFFVSLYIEIHWNEVTKHVLYCFHFEYITIYIQVCHINYHLYWFDANITQQKKRKIKQSKLFIKYVVLCVFGISAVWWNSRLCLRANISWLN